MSTDQKKIEPLPGVSLSEKQKWEAGLYNLQFMNSNEFRKFQGLLHPEYYRRHDKSFFDYSPFAHITSGIEKLFIKPITSSHLYKNAVEEAKKDKQHWQDIIVQPVKKNIVDPFLSTNLFNLFASGLSGIEQKYEVQAYDLSRRYGLVTRKTPVITRDRTTGKIRQEDVEKEYFLPLIYQYYNSDSIKDLLMKEGPDYLLSYAKGLKGAFKTVGKPFATFAKEDFSQIKGADVLDTSIALAGLSVGIGMSIAKRKQIQEKWREFLQDKASKSEPVVQLGLQLAVGENTTLKPPILPEITLGAYGIGKANKFTINPWLDPYPYFAEGYKGKKNWGITAAFTHSTDFSQTNTASRGGSNNNEYAFLQLQSKDTNELLKILPEFKHFFMMQRKTDVTKLLQNFKSNEEKLRLQKAMNIYPDLMKKIRHYNLLDNFIKTINNPLKKQLEERSPEKDKNRPDAELLKQYNISSLKKIYDELFPRLDKSLEMNQLSEKLYEYNTNNNEQSRKRSEIDLVVDYTPGRHFDPDDIVNLTRRLGDG